eukprot:m.109769 g.109769  ORF g.109769 m.109769 type:complete len:608 (-) comp9314_c0_seq1:63-1886(-)
MALSASAAEFVPTADHKNPPDTLPARAVLAPAFVPGQAAPEVSSGQILLETTAQSTAGRRRRRGGGKKSHRKDKEASNPAPSAAAVEPPQPEEPPTRSYAALAATPKPAPLPPTAGEVPPVPLPLEQKQRQQQQQKQAAPAVPEALPAEEWPAPAATAVAPRRANRSSLGYRDAAAATAPVTTSTVASRTRAWATPQELAGAPASSPASATVQPQKQPHVAQPAERGGRGKPSRDGIMLDLSALLTQQRKSGKQGKQGKPTNLGQPSQQGKIKTIPVAGNGRRGASSAQPLRASKPARAQDLRPVNALDSTAPIKRRGKEREGPKKSKPSRLKKVILAERIQRRIAGGGGSEDGGGTGDEEEVDAEAVDADANADDDEEIAATNDNTGADEENDGEDAAKLDPAAQQQLEEQLKRYASVLPLHVEARFGETTSGARTRRREYCDHKLSKQLDKLATQLLKELSRFQRRLKAANKLTKAKRRFVIGLHEVHKHSRLKNLSAVLMAPDIERIQAEGGLDDVVSQILGFCREREPPVPVFFVLGRHRLGRVLNKSVPVSIVGVMSIQGVNEIFREMVRQLAELVEQAADGETDDSATATDAPEAAPPATS